jgi:O-glycosyl hydrolase
MIKNRMTRVASTMFLAISNICGFAQEKTTVFTVNTTETVQTIENFGASGCWFSEGIGRYWPQGRKDSIARLLFSKEMDAEGTPAGIGLSSWRFNIGGGTAEQAEKSGIRTSVKRVECFLDEKGNYDWSKQSGYQWFLRKAKAYGVENLIAFSNTPPVHFTKNGLGFKTEKDYSCNLAEDKYSAYATFLTKVLRHFYNEGLHFKFVSPVNEPQWDWSNKFGEMNQEGSPWHNSDVYRITGQLDSALRASGLATKILLPEAATLKHLYGERGQAANQIRHFFGPTSPLAVRKFVSVYPIVAGHSYFTDEGDSNRISIRRTLNDTAAAYKVPFWQSEYSMLGNGYKEKKEGRIPAIDCALFLAKMIHTDLTVANATAWQLWNAYEPGSAEFDTRYYLIALKTNDSNTMGTFTATKNLWAMGHYSRFIRPGMKRVSVSRNDNLSEEAASADVMCSAYTDRKGRVVIVIINYSQILRNIDCTIAGNYTSKRWQLYTTTKDAGVDMKPRDASDLHKLALPPRSINTIVVDK